jgi:integrase
MAGRKITPTYRFHKKTGKAIVAVYDATGQRQSILLPGKFESTESRKAYKRLLARLDANEGQLPEPEEKKPDPLISELILKFMEQRVIPYYVDRHTKQPTGEQENFRCAMRPLNRLFGDLPASEFGPQCLVAVRQAMIDDGLARGTINTRIGRIKMMFRWAAEMQVIAASIFHGVLAVRGLAPGRSAARETDPVNPVAIHVVEQTLSHLPPVVRDVVELLLLAGMRVGEAVIIRAIDIDMSGPVWLYRPVRHKTLWRGHKRVIAIGPRGQDIIRKYLKPKMDALLFSPAEQEVMIAVEKRARRKSRVQPSQMCRKKAKPTKKPGQQFSAGDINQAIKRACKRAAIPRWHTHQLRHTCALEVSRHHGLESARAVLGHRTVQMSAHYSGHDQQTAAAVMGKIG